MDNNENTVTAVREIIEKYFEPRVLQVEGTKGLIIAPEGMSVAHAKQFIEKEQTAPEVLKGSTSLHNCNSFIEFVNRYKTENSALFYNQSEQKITCIFDCATKEKTSFEQHKASYAFPFSDELQEWQKHNASPMPQIEFAYFIEKNVLDLSEPPANDGETDALKNIRLRIGGHYAGVNRMVELSRGISIHNDERATIKHDINTGEAVVDFSSEHTDMSGNKVKVPNMFLIVIPVLKGGKMYQLPCRLRYRLKEGVIRWWYEVIDLDKAIEKAIDEELDTIKKDISLPVYYGDLPQGR
ncbi:MAG: DUF2303 family protein [Alphaproteobacteria bacterium]|nr:DUF2303 family protein [Alphaproteobacteria bacterium]